MGGIDLEGPEPLYRQIAAVLRARIQAGDYPPNRAIPSEAQLAEEFGVARPTVRAAIALLNGEGLTRPVRGKGTYVVQQEAPPES